MTVAAASVSPRALALGTNRPVGWQLTSRHREQRIARKPDLNKLLVASGRGDQKAYARLFDAISGAVFGTIRKILIDQAMSEEVTQEVMLEVWQKASQFSPDRGAAVSWILTTAHRRAVDRVRSEEAARAREHKVGVASVEPSYDATGASVEERMQTEQLLATLGVLTELEREAIEMAYFDGLTYSQVADKLGVPVGTIKTRMRSGLLRLKGELANE